jgi:hypothetical protein
VSFLRNTITTAPHRGRKMTRDRRGNPSWFMN